MKKRFLTATLILFSTVVSSVNALAARETTTVQGVLGTSPADKGLLITSDNKEYYFDPTTAAGKKILSICQIGKGCIVRGVIKGSEILFAYYVEIGK